MAVAPAFDDPWIPATHAANRSFNRWVHLALDSWVNRHVDLDWFTPERHALLLALGLAHLARAQACLDRGDWPELVAELRAYPVRPTPPEILALFDPGED